MCTIICIYIYINQLYYLRLSNQKTKNILKFIEKQFQKTISAIKNNPPSYTIIIFNINIGCLLDILMKTIDLNNQIK